MHARTIRTSSLTPLAEWELQNQIQQALSNQFTGQIQIKFLNGRTESAFVQRGIVRNLYVRNHRAPDLDWRGPLTHFGRGMLMIEPLPARALLFRKVILEEMPSPQPVPSGTSQLNTMFSLAEHNQTSTLFHIQWESAEALVVVAGGHIPIRYSILLTSAGTEEGHIAFEHILGWEEARCNVMIYHGDIKKQAWLELHLNILFEWYCHNILSYYTQLTGVVMVKSILQSLSVFAETKGWNISTQHQHIRDASIFSTAQEAGQAYTQILAFIRTRIEPIIGYSLTQYLIERSVESTRGVYKTIQETFGLVGDTQ